MGQRAVFSMLILPEKPDNRRYEVDRRFHKEISGFTYPFPVQPQHYSAAGFSGIRDISHAFRMERVATIGKRQIIKIDNVKLRLYGVAMPVLQKSIVSNDREIIEFEVIDEHGKTLADVLRNDMPNDEITFTCSRRTNHEQGPERINNVNP
jgi:hypothetical protein